MVIILCRLSIHAVMTEIIALYRWCEFAHCAIQYSIWYCTEIFKPELPWLHDSLIGILVWYCNVVVLLSSLEQMVNVCNNHEVNKI